MKNSVMRLSQIAAILAFLIASIACSSPLWAQQQAPVVVGIVDVEKIARDSKAGKSIKAELKRQRDAFEAEVAKQQKSFDALGKKLLEQKDTLSKEDLEKKKNEINKQRSEIEKKLGDRLRTVDEKANKARNKVFDTMAQITQDVAKARGMTLVVTRAAALVYDANYEITDEVMQKLDAKLPSVKLQ